VLTTANYNRVLTAQPHHAVGLSNLAAMLFSSKRDFVEAEGIYIYIFTHTHTHTSIYVYIMYKYITYVYI
jgi:hypothetical protein